MAGLLLLLTFTITPLGAMVLFLLSFKMPSQRRYYIFFTGLLFGIIGYCMTPTREIDISRYWQQLDMIRNYSFAWAFNWASDGLVLKNFLFWLISKLDDNHLLPFFSMFIVYFSAAYIICCSDECDTGIFGIVLIIEILALPIYNIFSNVRNVTAFSLVSVAVFRDLYKNKRNIVTLLMYVIPCFIHISGFVVVLLRLCIIIVRKTSQIGVWCMLGIPTIIVSLYPYLQNIHLPGNVGIIFSYAIWKAYASIVRTSEYSQVMQDSRTFIISRLLTILFILALYFLTKDYIAQNKDNRKKDYAYYVEVVLMVTFFMSVLGVVKYWVFAFLLFIASTPILSGYITTRHNWDIRYLILITICVGSTAFLFLLQLRVFILDIDVRSFLINLLFTDHLVVLYRIIKGLLY